MEKYNKHIIEEPVASTVISHRFSHAVWGAIFAGTVVILVVQLTLALLGSGIGFSSLNITQGNNIKALGAGTVIWWIISGCISFYIGGLVTGRLAGIPRRLDGMLHGIITWSVTTIAMFVFLTTTLGVVSAGAFGVLHSGAQAISSMAPQAGQALSDVAPQETQNDINHLKNNVRQVLDRIQNPAQREQLQNAVMALGTTSNPDQEKQQITNILVQSGQMNQTDAQNTVNRWSQNAQMIKQNFQMAARNAAQSTQEASRVAAGMALASFIMLLLGAFFAGLGGSIGAPHWADQEIA
jgi:hypothetical protein